MEVYFNFFKLANLKINLIILNQSMIQKKTIKVKFNLLYTTKIFFSFETLIKFIHILQL